MIVNPPLLRKCIQEMQDKANSHKNLVDYYCKEAVRYGTKDSMETAKREMEKADTVDKILNELITIVKVNWPEPAAEGELELPCLSKKR